MKNLVWDSTLQWSKINTIYICLVFVIQDILKLELSSIGFVRRCDINILV